MSTKQAIIQHNLPATLCRDIGRVITKWAYVENYLQHIIYMLLGTSAGAGRIAIREPRASERLAIILDLVAAIDLREPAVNLKTLREAMLDAEDFRNHLAHGTWSYSKEHAVWAVTVARGTWEGIPKTERAKRNKRLRPEGQLIRAEVIKSYIAGIDAIIGHVRLVQADLETQLREQPSKRPVPELHWSDADEQI